MGHGLLKKVNFYFIFSEKLIFRGKMPLKCSNNAQCFCLTKILEKNASIMYKSLSLSFQSGPIIRLFRTNWFIFIKKNC